MILRLLVVILQVPAMADASRAGVDAARVDALVSLYGRAQERLRAIVLNPAGRTEGSRDYRQMRAAQQLRQVEALLAELGDRRASWAGAAAPDAYRRGLERATTEAAEAGVNVDGSPLRGTFSQVDRDAVEALASDIATDLANADRSMGERARYLLTKTSQEAIGEAQLNRILAGGVIEGTPAGTVRELRDALRAVVGDTISVPTRSGGTMQFATAHYARLVAVTKTREAMEVGRHNRFRDVGVDLVRVVGTFSGNFCTAYLGKVFSLSGSHPVYPPIARLPRGGPPFHPFCGKSTAAFVEELASPRQVAEARGLADADRLLGVTAAEAQRRFDALGLQQQVLGGYAKGFTPARTAGVAEQEPARSRRQALTSPAPRPKGAR